MGEQDGCCEGEVLEGERGRERNGIMEWQLFLGLYVNIFVNFAMPFFKHICYQFHISAIQKVVIVAL